MVRRRRGKALSGGPTPSSSVDGVLRRRSRKPQQQSCTPQVLPHDSHEIMTGLLRGPTFQKFRDGKHIHVSDIIYKCARKIALSKRLGIPMDPEPIFDSTGLTFAQGEAIASFIVNKAADSAPRRVYGIWGCACGRTRVEGTRHSVLGKKCDTCGRGLDTYHEYRVTDDETGLSGSIDLLHLEDRAFVPVEIKSIKKEAWDELARPVPEHLIQVLFYWDLLNKSGHSVQDKAIVLYATKGYVFGSPYKEFVIHPSQLLYRLEEYQSDAVALKACIHDNGDLPARVTCSTIDSPAAKKCQFRDHCFSCDNIRS